MTISPSTSRLTNLPLQLTSLVGREREIAAVVAHFRHSNTRLVTLTGPGGVGKTRLALAVADALVGSFADGVAFADLAPVRDPDLVMPAIAAILGVREAGQFSVADRLALHLRDREILLILDNFEQILDATPGVARLLAAAPGLSILATSREPLKLSGEQVFPIGPLKIPDPDRQVDAENIQLSDAVSLFVQRAHAADPDFALTSDNAVAVAGIVRRLDGLPLAIELAAARVPTLPPEALLTRLEQQALRLLTGGPRDHPDRQRTMRDTIAWSYDLLSPTDQSLFRRLSVFVGGFTLETAVTVAGEEAGLDVLDGVASLLDKSLVRRVITPAGEPRFVMLETVREYGLEQLAASDEESDVRHRHAAWCLSLVERGEPFWLAAGEARWLEQLEEELDNVRAALAWSLEHDEGEPEIGLQLAGLVDVFWQVRGHLSEGARWLELALSRGAGCSPEARARAQIMLGLLATYLASDDSAAAVIEAGVTLCREVGDQKHLGGGLTILGTLAEDRGDYDRATALLTEALALARARKDPGFIAWALQHLGLVTYGQGDLTLATARCEEALALQRSVGDGHGAKASLIYLALIACDRGEHARAATLYGEALALAAEHRTLLGAERCLAGLAAVATTCGAPEQAARLFGAAEVVSEVLGIGFKLPERVQYERARSAARDALGDARFEAAFAAGRALDQMEATAAGAKAAVVLAAISPATPPAPSTAFGLTPREQDVLKLVVAGHSNRQIAEALYISHRTATTHVGHILAKLEVGTRAEAAAWGVRHGVT